ncbi:MAG: hypothetical protein HGA83_07060, partial [Bacteroidales bacterium]|nr:hypothetical protein [Bacteroidales bacterium]
MEEKILSEKESLELISKMISETKNKLERGGGNIFLLWGYLGVCVSLIVYGLLNFTENYAVQWLWFLIPVIGYPAMFFMKGKSQTGSVTFIGSVISKIWIVIGVCTILVSISILYDYTLLPILFIMSLLVTAGVAMSGLVLKFKPAAVAGFIGIILSFVLLLVSWKSQILVFAAMSAIML